MSTPGTPITSVTVDMPPLEMWVEGNTTSGYLDFDVIQYEAPPPWLTGVWSGRALIREQGGPETHTYSPELVALHQVVCKAIERNTPPMFPGKGHRWSPASKEFTKDHTRLFGMSIDYHGKLMAAQQGDALETVQERVVAAFGALSQASQTKGATAAWMTIKDTVEHWIFKDTPQNTEQNREVNDSV